MTVPSDDPEFKSKFQKLLYAANIAEEEQLRNLEEAMRLADAHGDLLAGMRAQIQFIRVAEFAGRYEQTLICFTWCLGTCEKNPDLYRRFISNLLWYFKWITSSVPRFAGVPRKQIESMMAEMVRYYDREGKSHRAIHGVRAKNAVYLGDIDQVSGHRDAWLAAPPDGSQDCPACEADSSATLYLATNEFEKAINAGEGLLSGRMTCAEQPHNGQSLLLVPLFRLGRFELADAVQRKSSRKIRDKPEHLSEIACHIAFLTATDQLTRAMNMFEEGARQFPIVRRPWDRMLLFANARILFLRLQEKRYKSVKFRLPPTFEQHRPDNTYSTKDLFNWCDAGTRQLAGEFDRRNGNDYISRLIREPEQLLTMIHPMKAGKSQES